MHGKITTVLTKKQAETYRAQGLHKEARKLYDGLLASSPNIDPQLKSAIQSKIQGINQELAQADPSDHRQLSVLEIHNMRKGWGEQANPRELLICAQSFMQIDAYDEAIKEYANLIHLTGIKKSYLKDIATCLVHLRSPASLPPAVEALANVAADTSDTRLAMQLALTKQMVDQNHTKHALAMYQHVRAYPEVSARPELSAKIDTWIGKLSVADEKPPGPDAPETRSPSPVDEVVDSSSKPAHPFNPFAFLKRKQT